MYGACSIADIQIQLGLANEKPYWEAPQHHHFISRTPQRREQFHSMDVIQCDLDNETMKDLMVVCNNDTRWNSASNMLERALQSCSSATELMLFVNATKRIREDSDDNGSAHQTL